MEIASRILWKEWMDKANRSEPTGEERNHYSSWIQSRDSTVVRCHWACRTFVLKPGHQTFQELTPLWPSFWSLGMTHIGSFCTLRIRPWWEELRPCDFHRLATGGLSQPPSPAHWLCDNPSDAHKGHGEGDFKSKSRKWVLYKPFSGVRQQESDVVSWGTPLSYTWVFRCDKNLLRVEDIHL